MSSSSSAAQGKRPLNRSKGKLIRVSDSFPDPVVLQADSPYRPGTRSGWIKVKTERWKAANQYRVKLFDKRQQQNGGAPGRRRAIPGAHVRGYANRLQAATD